jgi:hypothetical protein
LLALAFACLVCFVFFSSLSPFLFSKLTTMGNESTKAAARTTAIQSKPSSSSSSSSSSEKKHVTHSKLAIETMKNIDTLAIHADQ